MATARGCNSDAFSRELSGALTFFLLPTYLPTYLFCPDFPMNLLKTKISSIFGGSAQHVAKSRKTNIKLYSQNYSEISEIPPVRLLVCLEYQPPKNVEATVSHPSPAMPSAMPPAMHASSWVKVVVQPTTPRAKLNVVNT